MIDVKEKILKNILIKKKSLINYAQQLSDYNFYELFPKNEFDFSQTNYKQYFYFGKNEAVALIKDYFTLIKKAYNYDSFSYEHFYSVIKEFFEHLQSLNVFTYEKTYYGHKILNNNIIGFEDECVKILGSQLQKKDNPNFNEFLIPNINVQEKYNFEFFDFLESKIKQTLINYEFVLEPILKEDCQKFSAIYNNQIKINNVPFYLNKDYKYFKYIKPKVENYVLCMLPKEKAFTAVTAQGKEVALIILSPNDNNEIVLNIICDCDYFDSSFFNVLEIIKNYVFNNLYAKIIVGKNVNEGMAYSTIETAYSMAKFMPKYDNAVGDNGLTRIEHVFKLSDYLFSENLPLMPLKPISYATFSVYK